ncbi:DNA-3-methyladenine glycosylase I [Mucilaginibacter pedocola]|nr:DNA-3-methyladenine glycosylase I [Mucilaginibacter pedocola]
MEAGDRKDLHKKYHDGHYGYPITNDNELFGRLIMEINQAGLSWETILKKEVSFRNAYHNFDVRRVAAYDDADRARLLAAPGIIRNRLKVNAAIENAKAIMGIQAEYGSFLKWLEHHHPKSKEEWIKLFKKAFRFTGGEIVNEFLMSIGFLPGAHIDNCPVFNKVMEHHPMWAKD